MTDLIWVLECDQHCLKIKDRSKTEVNRLYTLHVRKGCQDIKKPYPIQLDERFTI